MSGKITNHMNEELIASAVTFLKDPSVLGSPLAKRVEFLESKGLSQEEIEEALQRANGTTGSTSTSAPASTTPTPSTAVQPSPPVDYYNVAPPPPERSWKDYFIMATATAGVTYGLYQVVSKYLIPSIIPPTQTSIDKDKEKIDEEFLKIDKVLEQLAQDQDEIKEQNSAKLKEVDTVIENINDFLSKYNKDKLKFDDDLRLMKLEIDNLSNSINKNLSQTKENMKDDLTEINEELQLLKQLVKNRQANSASAQEPRKLALASLIPSALEILKKAREKAGGDKKETKTVEKEPVQSKEPTQEKVADPSMEISEPTTFNGITAGGIPAWQLEHQKKEEEKLKKEESKKESKEGVLPEDEAVKKTLEKVGVPAWQLNNKDKDNSKSIPSWQTSA